MTVSKYALIVLSLVIMLRCIRSMLSDRYEPETWASVRFGRESVPVTHWENLIGRSRTADIRIDREGIERIHAVLKRRDNGTWMLYDVFSRGGVSVKEIEPGTMRSKKFRNLYFAGEMIDVDAHTGGYNLQIAWSTGALAGQSASSIQNEE